MGRTESESLFKDVAVKVSAVLIAGILGWIAHTLQDASTKIELINSRIVNNNDELDNRGIWMKQITEKVNNHELRIDRLEQININKGVHYEQIFERISHCPIQSGGSSFASLSR